MAEMRLSGVVLAAGRSTRMGRDKALLPAPGGAGVVMWERQRDVLRAAGVEEVFLSARPEQAWARAVENAENRERRREGEADRGSGGTGERGRETGRGFAAVLSDALPGCGPMAGITAALERATHASHVAVLAVDLPQMRAEWFATLRERCESGVGAVGGRGEFFEPLAAIYPREVMWDAWEMLARGEYAMQRLVARAVAKGMMCVREIADGEAELFANWNEPVEGR